MHIFMEAKSSAHTQPDLIIQFKANICKSSEANPISQNKSEYMLSIDNKQLRELVFSCDNFLWELLSLPECTSEL